MFTKTFIKDMAERAIATFCQTVIAIIGVTYMSNPLVLLDINWIPVLIAGFIGAILSILKAIVASFTGDKSSASLVK